MSTPLRIAIVGAGIGGLTSAARLAHAGHQVTVYEKNAGPGGRCGVVREDGFQWDLGPTLLLMRDVVEAPFRELGRDPADYLTLTRCDPNYDIHFGDGTHVAFSTDLARMRDQLEAIEPGSFAKYLAFLEFGRHAYDTSLAHVVTRPLDGLLSYLNPKLLRHVFSMGAHRTLHGFLRRWFKDERLLQATSFQTMYLGLSPYEAPATYALLPYTELAMGIWFPKGGLHEVARALERLGREVGVRFRYETPVERIVVERGKVTGIRTQAGLEPFDLVVANADLPYVCEKLVPEASFKKGKSMRYTSSAYMLYLGVDRKFDQLGHHTVVFGQRYRETFQEIFHDLKVPQSPSFYVCRASGTDPDLAPAGCDALYVLIPVPHNADGLDWAVEGPKLRDRIIDEMEKRLGLEGLRGSIRVEKHFSPNDWQSQLNLVHGAAFGLSHGFSQVGALRPSTRDARIRNLYFTGASTQPGTGVPLVMLSAKIVAERIAREWGQPERIALRQTLPGAA